MANTAATAFAVSFIAAILISSAAAHNITQILEQYPDFVSFNQILSQTKIADEINRRHTITVLAVANSELDAVSGRRIEQVENIMRVHVILDYYGPQKLANLKKKTAILTTLFQTTGRARGQSGFLNVTNLPSNQIAFGSAVAGAGLDSYLVKSIAAQPYNISVLQVSELMVPPNIDQLGTPAPGTPPPAPAASVPAAAPKKAATSPSPSGKDDAKSATPAEAPVAEDGSEDVAAPADAPTTTAPAPAEAFDADSPVPVPAASDNKAPAHKNSASGVGAGFAAVGVALGVAVFGTF